MYTSKVIFLITVLSLSNVITIEIEGEFDWYGMKINKLNIIERVDICSSDPYISFTFGNKIEYGFLSHDNKIVNFSEPIECPEKEEVTEETGKYLIKQLKEFVGIEPIAIEPKFEHLKNTKTSTEQTSTEQTSTEYTYNHLRSRSTTTTAALTTNTMQSKTTTTTQQTTTTTTTTVSTTGTTILLTTEKNNKNTSSFSSIVNFLFEFIDDRCDYIYICIIILSQIVPCFKKAKLKRNIKKAPLIITELREPTDLIEEIKVIETNEIKRQPIYKQEAVFEANMTKLVENIFCSCSVGACIDCKCAIAGKKCNSRCHRGANNNCCRKNN